MKKESVWDKVSPEEIQSLVKYGSFNERMRIQKHIHKLMDTASYKEYDVLCELLMLVKQTEKDSSNGQG
jgi:hypothetical protein